MDYEKLHKDTINKLQQMVNSGKITVETACGICADFVPESEDERIKKALIKLVKKAGEGYENVSEGVSIQKAIAWLEKQGENIYNKELSELLHKVICRFINDPYIPYSDREKVSIKVLPYVELLEKQGEQNTNTHLPSFDEAQGTPMVKQGEQKFRIGDTITNGDLVGIIDEINEYGYHACFGDHYADVPYKGIENWKLVEQKPAEYEKPLLEKFKQAVYDCAWGKVTCKVEGESKQEYANRWAESLLLMVRDWADDYIDSREDVIRRRAYNEGKNCHKPAEWSEEDENMLKMVIKSCEQCGNEYAYYWLKNLKNRVQPQPQQEWGEEDEDYLNFVIAQMKTLQVECTENEIKQHSSSQAAPYYGKIINWLESLKERVLPKIEWSEEDETMITDLNVIVHTYFSEISGIPFKYDLSENKIRTWLKSLRDRYTWKPSDEQMLALEAKLTMPPQSLAMTSALIELYQNLKKLREE